MNRKLIKILATSIIIIIMFLTLFIAFAIASSSHSISSNTRFNYIFLAILVNLLGITGIILIWKLFKKINHK